MKKLLAIALATGLAVGFVIASPLQMASAGGTLQSEEESFYHRDRGPGYHHWNESELSEEALEEREQWHEERNEARIAEINQAIEEGAISEEEGQEMIQAIEEGYEFEDGICPMGGPGRMNFGPRFDGDFERDENSDWGFRNNFDSRHRGNGRGSGGFGGRQGW